MRFCLSVLIIMIMIINVDIEKFYLIDITNHFCVDKKAITGAKIYLVSQSGTCH